MQQLTIKISIKSHFFNQTMFYAKKAKRFKDIIQNSVIPKAVSKEIFFAHQLIPNSCASHALLSVLLNSNDVEKGEFLSQLRKWFQSKIIGPFIFNPNSQ